MSNPNSESNNIPPPTTSLPQVSDISPSVNLLTNAGLPTSVPSPNNLNPVTIANTINQPNVMATLASPIGNTNANGQILHNLNNGPNGVGSMPALPNVSGLPGGPNGAWPPALHGIPNQFGHLPNMIPTLGLPTGGPLAPFGHLPMGNGLNFPNVKEEKNDGLLVWVF